MATIKISCETQDAKIMYTTDDSEPTESSNLYSDVFEVDSPVTIKARAYKDGYDPSDIATKIVKKHVTVPMALPDGSVLFYDRGASYGEYHIDDTGYPVRDDDAIDDETAESQNWRYFICDLANLSERKQWGPYNISEGMTDTKYEDIGYGLPNTETMLLKYRDNITYLWNLIQARRDATGGKKWFLPSKDELNIVYQNKDIITQNGGGSFPTDYSYWSSSEGYVILVSWLQNFSDGSQNVDSKGVTRYCRLLRRI